MLNNTKGTGHIIGWSLKRLEEIGLFHYLDEVLLLDLTITVLISLFNHFPELLISHIFSQLLCHSLKFLEANAAFTFSVKESEGLPYLFLRVSFFLFGVVFSSLFFPCEPKTVPSWSASGPGNLYTQSCQYPHDPLQPSSA